jgi:hypothetical protein
MTLSTSLKDRIRVDEWMRRRDARPTKYNVASISEIEQSYAGPSN